MLCLPIATALAIMTAAPRTQVSGNAVLSYGDLLNGSAPTYASEHGQVHVDQLGLSLTHRFTDGIEAYIGLVHSGSTMTANEVWMRFDGLPLEGAFTVGRFYKPLGAPIPLATLSFPALMFHVYTDVGAKLHFRHDIWSFELGVVNGAPVSGPSNQSGQIGGSRVYSNIAPSSGPDDNHFRDVYQRIEFALGEDWGSLTAGVTGTLGKLSNTEITGQQPTVDASPPPPPRLVPSNIGEFTTYRRDHQRRHVSADFDYTTGPWRLYGEAYYARDGRLRRTVWSIAGSRTFFTSAGEVTATLAHDILRVGTQRAFLGKPETWDRRRLAASLTWWPTQSVQILAEYDVNREDVYEVGGGRVDNDEIQVQSIYYF